MDGIADDVAETDWDIFFDRHANDIVTSIRIDLSSGFVWAFAEERRDFVVKITDVAFGPFDL